MAETVETVGMAAEPAQDDVIVFGGEKRNMAMGIAMLGAGAAAFVSGLTHTFFAQAIAWTFVLWGAIQGSAMAIHVAWRAWNPLISLKDSRPFQLGWTFLSHLLTLGVILVSDVYFQAASVSTANLYLLRILSWSSDGTRLISPYIVPAVCVVFLSHVLQNKDRNWPKEIPAKSLPVRLLAYTCLLLALVTLGATDAAPFVYFQF